MRTWHLLSLVVLLSTALAAVAQEAAQTAGDDNSSVSSPAPADDALADDGESPGADAETEDSGIGDDEADVAALAEEEDDEDDGIDLDDPAYADLDLQTYEEDDDDFVPTEEIPADQAIPFPSDI